MSTVTLASLESLRSELVKSKYYLNIRSGYMAPVTLHCSFGDSGQSITFYIFDGGEKLDLTGSTVTIHGTRRDGANFGPFGCSVSSNAVTFTLRATMTAVEGGGIAEFTITRNNSTIGTCNFGILVERAVFPNGVAYDTDPSVYQDILKYVQTTCNNLSVSERNHEATVATQISEFETYINNEVSQIIASGGDDNTEVVNARVTFDGTSKTTLKVRLDQFLEYDVAGTTDGIGTIESLEEEITRTVIAWLNTHPANLVYATDGTISFHIIKSTEDIDG